MNQPKSLKELVELAVQRHDASGLALSQIARKAGHPITYTTLNAIRQGTYKSVPREVTLRALAWLAGVDASVAFTAAGQPVPGPPFAEELPPGVDNLPPKARKAAIDMLRVLVDLNQDNNALQQERDGIRNREERNRVVHDYVNAMRTNGESGKRRNAIPGQKSLEPEEAAEREDQRRILTDLSNVEDLQAGGPRAEEYADNNIPLPSDYLDLAAHRATESAGRREHEAGRERGEESQEAE